MIGLGDKNLPCVVFVFYLGLLGYLAQKTSTADDDNTGALMENVIQELQMLFRNTLLCKIQACLGNLFVKWIVIHNCSTKILL